MTYYSKRRKNLVNMNKIGINAQRRSNLNSIAKVSVLVAVYNIEKYIQKCVESILNQDYKNLEIIIVDDCSSDSSGKICDEYALKDSRIKVIHHTENSRLPSVRNTGLFNATGEYIVFVDGDDWLASDFVSYMVNIISSTKSDMAISYNNFTTRDYRQIKEDYISIWSAEKATGEFLYSNITIGAWNKIYRRKFIEDNNIRFRKLFTAEGFRFINEAAQRANQIAVGHRKVYFYRLNNPGSATTKPDVRQGLGSLEALDGIKNDLIIKSPFIMDAILEHYFLNWEYTIRLIIQTKSKDVYSKEYNECKRNIRKNGWIVVGKEKTIYRKIRAILYTLSPELSAYVAIIKRTILLKKDLAQKEKG